MVFVRNRNKRREWLAIASTDITLEEAEIVRIYGISWKIETFFKCTKSYLKLGTEFQGRSFGMLISHTTIVFAGYLLLEWEQRKATDVRSIGGLFYICCDEIKDIDLKTALQQLMLFVYSLLQAQESQNILRLFVNYKSG